jgi:hypothetical protein
MFCRIHLRALLQSFAVHLLPSAGAMFYPSPSSLGEIVGPKVEFADGDQDFVPTEDGPRAGVVVPRQEPAVPCGTHVHQVKAQNLNL